jgi:hypothetical protein
MLKPSISPATQDKKETSSPQNRPLIRWWWIGLALSIILWLVSNIYYSQIQPLEEIDYLTDATSSEEIAQIKKSEARTHQSIHYAAIALGIASLSLLGRQVIQTMRSRHQ